MTYMLKQYFGCLFVDIDISSLLIILEYVTFDRGPPLSTPFPTDIHFPTFRTHFSLFLCTSFFLNDEFTLLYWIERQLLFPMTVPTLSFFKHHHPELTFALSLTRNVPDSRIFDTFNF